MNLWRIIVNHIRYVREALPIVWDETLSADE